MGHSVIPKDTFLATPYGLVVLLTVGQAGTLGRSRRNWMILGSFVRIFFTIPCAPGNTAELWPEIKG